MELIHFQPIPNNRNVRCLNGSAHARSTRDLNDVTCPLCKDWKTAFEFWSEKRAQYYARERQKIEQKIFMSLF